MRGHSFQKKIMKTGLKTHVIQLIQPSFRQIIKCSIFFFIPSWVCINESHNMWYIDSMMVSPVWCGDWCQEHYCHWTCSILLIHKYKTFGIMYEDTRIENPRAGLKLCWQLLFELKARLVMKANNFWFPQSCGKWL